MKKISCLIVSLLIFLSFSAIHVSASEPHTEASGSYLYGQIRSSSIDESPWGESTLCLIIRNDDGIITEYKCAASITVNGTLYHTSNTFAAVEGLQSVITERSFAQFEVIDDTITVLNFDDTPTTYNDATYNPATNSFDIDIDTSNLPVFYDYKPFTKPYLDENHLYCIDMYDYAVNITDIAAKDKPYAIKALSLYNGINYYLRQHLKVKCEATCEDFTFVAELYNSDGVLIQTKMDYGCYERSILDFNLRHNAAASYTVKMWLENQLGEIITPVYTKQYETEPIPVLYGKVIDSWIDISQWDEETVNLRISTEDGETNIYSCIPNAEVNGTSYYMVEDLQSAIPKDVLVEFVVPEDEITVLNYGDEIVGRTPYFVNNLSVDYYDGYISMNVLQNEDVDATFILCEYNSEDVLLSVDCFPIDDLPELYLQNFNDTTKVAVYVLDSLTSLKPLAKAKTCKVNPRWFE